MRTCTYRTAVSLHVTDSASVTSEATFEVTVVAATPDPYANLLVNSGFEDPEITQDWEVRSSIRNWTLAADPPPAEVEVHRDYPALASEGHQFLRLDADAQTTTMSQSFTTEVGTEYEASFDYAAASTQLSELNAWVLDGQNQTQLGNFRTCSLLSPQIVRRARVGSRSRGRGADCGTTGP